ncbi:hypothetical protein LJB82_04435 [Desulfovibrio sp. OttesenSCG-928-M16]|nr:hypothetical protein [Desulfovibrio sp. OttesenSCG-928-M16]
MSLIRSSLMGLLIVSCIVLLAGCSDPSDKLVGAWKTETVNPDTGKATVVLLTKESANINGNLFQVEYKSVALTVDVFDKVNQNSVFMATKIEKNSIEAQGRVFGEKCKLIRITEEEAFALLKEMQPS